MKIIVKFLIAALSLFFVIFSQGFSSEHNPQSASSIVVSLDADHQSLTVILKQIEEQTRLTIIFSNSFTDSIKISCHYTKVPVDDVLKKLLGGTALIYQWYSNNQIIIKPAIIKSSYDIEGYVIDQESGETLPYANVLLQGSRRGTVTNLQGRFIFLSIPSKLCTLQVQYIGYKPEFLSLLPDTLSQPFRVLLQKTPLPFDSVITTWENNAIIQSGKYHGVLTVSAENFSMLPVGGDQDILRSLQLLPGINGSEYGAAGPEIRGSSPWENLVLLDGIPLYNLNHSFGFLSAFNSDNIKSIRIHKGAYPAKYGDRLSSVLELTSKTGDFNRFRTGMRFTPLSGSAYLSFPITGRDILFLSGRHSYSRTILEDLYKLTRLRMYYETTFSRFEIPDENIHETAPVVKTIPKMTFYDFIGKFTLLPSKNDVLTFSYYLGADYMLKKNISKIFLPTMTGAEEIEMTSKENTDWGNKGYSVRWYKQWGLRFQSNFELAYSNYFTRYNRTDEVPVDSLGSPNGIVPQEDYLVDNHLSDLTLKLENKWQALEAHTVEFGIIRSALAVDYSEFKNGKPSALRQNKSTKNTVFYVQDIYRFHKLFEITPGIRADYNSLLRSLFWEPRISARYQYSPTITLKGGYGKFHQNLTRSANDLKFLDGRVSWLLADGKQVLPGKEEHMTAGMEYETEGYLVDFEFYNRKRQNILSVLTYDQTSLFINPEKLPQFNGFCDGFEILLHKKNGALRGWLTYTYSRSQLKYTNNNHQAYYPVTEDIPHQFKAVAHYHFKKWDFTASWIYLSGRPYSVPTVDYIPGTGLYYLYPADPPNNNRLPPVHQLDISIQYSLEILYFDSKISFSALNVFDRKNTYLRYFDIYNGKLLAVDLNRMKFTPTISLEFNLK